MNIYRKRVEDGCEYYFSAITAAQLTEERNPERNEEMNDG